MKKVLLFILVITSLSLSACTKKTTLESRVSQLRASVFCGENDKFLLEAYPETRETNMLADGLIGEKSDYIVFKLVVKDGTISDYKLTFTLDKEYSAIFSFAPHADSFIATVKVDNYPDTHFTAALSVAETTEIMELYSKLTDNLIDYKTALNKVETAEKEFITALNENERFEIHMRVMSVKNNLFWFIGFVEPKQTTAFLLDNNGKILAKKVLPNNL